MRPNDTSNCTIDWEDRTMGLMIVRHEVKNFGTWKKSFDRRNQ